MADVYRGDSPSKKYARYLCWATIVKMMGADKFSRGKHLVLASREGGDIACLLMQDVPPKNIVAVEHNSVAAHEAQEKYPQVSVVCRDVVKIAQECKRTLSSAYLDFCGTANTSLVHKICQVIMHGLKDESYLAVTVLSGRESGELRKEILARKAKPFADRRFHSLSDRDLVEVTRMGVQKTHDEYARYLTEALADPRKLVVAAAEVRASQQALYSDQASPLARMHYLRETLTNELARSRTTVHPVAMLHYTSTTRDAHGVPMCVVIFKVRRFTRSMPLEKFKWTSNRFGQEEGSTQIINCNMGEAELRNLVLELADLTEQARDADKLLPSTVTPVELVAGLFNLRKESIIAWRAHQTRGTYQKEDRT